MTDIMLKSAVDDVLNSHFMMKDNTLNLGYFEETILELVDVEELVETNEPVGLYVWRKIGEILYNEVKDFFPWKKGNELYQIVCFANEWICEKSPMIMSDICRRIQRKFVTYRMLDEAFEKDRKYFAKSVKAIADNVGYCYDIVTDKKCSLEIYVDDIVDEALKFYKKLYRIADIDDVKEWAGKDVMCKIIEELEEARREYNEEEV